MKKSQIMRIALVGLNQTPLDWKGNLARIQTAIERARALDSRLICFPELALSGYGCEDHFLHPHVASRALKILQQLATETRDEIILLGLPFTYEGSHYNAVAVLNQGRIAGIVLKSHLAREGIHYEPRWFRPWPAGKVEQTRIGAEEVPVGTLKFNGAGLSFALEICEDAWVSSEQRPSFRDAAWIFNCSASHFSMGKAVLRETLVRESSRRFGVGYAYCNLVGCESGRAIYDGEQLIAEFGEISNRSKRLFLDDVLLLSHDIHYQDREAADGHVLLKVDEQLPSVPIAPIKKQRHLVEAEEELAQAATLGLLDYMRKSRSRGFTLSLSGGVDSSTVAVLVAIMVHRLIEELTPSQRRAKLAYLDDELDLETGDPAVLMGKLLTTVYQATRNSGEVTRRAASTLAAAIGANHLELDVDDMVAGYTRLVGQALNRELTWEHDDIALQNIQARVRGPSVWMLANIRGSLLLSTSNRSEVAVGYATMDGDTCGGLAPIAGVEKTYLRHWLERMQHHGLPGIPAIPQLHLVNEQEPTAELRPPQAAQTDEADLMPYPVLDSLESTLIAQRRTPLEAFRTISDRFGTRYEASVLLQWTRRFCRLFTNSQWKRERYAPAFHLDDRNLDPKTWARYPILSSAFEMELEELPDLLNDCHPID